MAKMTFEDSMKQLEKIVEELEAGDLPLEKALKKFEEGVRLSKFCFDKLDETEKKIAILLKDQNGNIQEEPFIKNDIPAEGE
jgi:exodeoxyribonuclease VII small subunit